MTPKAAAGQGDHAGVEATAREIVRALHAIPRLKIETPRCIGCQKPWTDDHNHDALHAEWPDDIIMLVKQEVYHYERDTEAEVSLIADRLRTAPPSGLTPPSGGATAPDPRETFLAVRIAEGHWVIHRKGWTERSVPLAVLDHSRDGHEPTRRMTALYAQAIAIALSDGAPASARSAAPEGTSPVAGAPQHEH